MHPLISLSFFLAVLHLSSNAVILPLDIRSVPPLQPRGSASAIQNLTSLDNTQYVTNITISGVELTVSIDTGSFDLWASFPGTAPGGLTDTGKSLSLSYAVGSASGDIHTGPVTFGNFTVNNQAFLLVQNSSTFPGTQGTNGLLGLGFNSGSFIYKALGKSSSGNTFMQRIFEQGNTAANYITFLLGREGASGQLVQGYFSVAETIPGFGNITSMPKLDVETVSRLIPSSSAQQHWQAFTNKDNGIIGPDGNPIQISSIVPKAPDGQYVAVFDSGFTFSQVPRTISDAIYGRVQGATFDTVNQWWTVPCGQYLNVSFNFAGFTYPIHPLDLVDDLGLTDSTGKKICLGAYQPITSAYSIFGTFDMILGMSFLRNAYALLDYGNSVDDSLDQVGPYIQLASVTNSIAAQKDFVNIRLGGNASALSDPRYALLPANESQHSPIPPGEKTKELEEKILSHLAYIVVGVLVLIVLITGCCIWRCCCRGRGGKCCRRKTKQLPTNDQRVFPNSGDVSYVQLENRSTKDDQSTYSLPAYQEDYGKGGRGYSNQDYKA